MKSITTSDFPALRSFLRGYFHQDMKDEYASAAEAVEEFCADASAEERAAVAKDWSSFLERAQGQPLAEINRALTGPLGSSCAMTQDDLQVVSAALAKKRKS